MCADFEYICHAYRVPAKKGGRVIYSMGDERLHGTITGARGAHVLIRIDGDKMAKPFHPTWNLEYVVNEKPSKGE